MGAFFGGGKTKTTQSSTATTNSGPAAFQQPFLQNAMDQAQQQYNADQANLYHGPYSAAQTAPQAEGAQSLIDYANGTGTDLARQVGSQASTLGSATSGFVNTAGALAADGAGAANPTAASVLSAQANGAMAPQTLAGMQGQAATSGAIGNATTLAANGQGNINPSIQQNAGGYVNNDILNGQIDAANRDVARGLAENTLPGLNARAVAGGNINSSRAGAAEAVATRGAQEQMADTAATIRGNAYNEGINASLAANSQQNALALGANAQLGALGTATSALGNNQQQFATTNAQGAAATLGSQDIANRGLQAQTQLAANAQQGQAAGMGVDTAAAAGGLARQNAADLAAGGAAQQAEAQRQIDEAQAQILTPQQQQAQNLQNYFGVVGSNNWGQTGTSTSNGTQIAQQPKNVLGGVLGLASLAAAPFTGGASLAGLAGGALSGATNAFNQATGLGGSNYAYNTMPK